MPKLAAEMSPIQITRIADPGLHFVGVVPGLAMQVRGNSKSWILRVRIVGKTRDIGLGGYPDVTLALAREKARALREQIRQGVDPLEERRAQRAALEMAQGMRVTFSEAARAFIATKKHEWNNAKSAQQWENTIQTYAVPVIGDMYLNEIELGHVLKVLEPIWMTKTETASRLRGRIESILDWAKVHRYREGENPARWKGNLDKVLPKPGKTKQTKHHAALPYDELGPFMERLRERSGMAALALQFCILTAARSGEVRGATWSEINLSTSEWIIPAERMKAGKEHTVPLSPQALKILKAVPRGGQAEILFKAKRGGTLSDMTLSAVLRRMGVAVTVHGFRSTFRDWAGELSSFPREVIEHALAHQLQDKAEAAYARSTLVPKRKRLMESWGSYCTRDCSTVGEVLSMKAR